MPKLTQSQAVTAVGGVALVVLLAFPSWPVAFALFVVGAAAAFQAELEAREASNARVHKEALRRLDGQDEQLAELQERLTELNAKLVTVDNRTRKNL